MISCQKKTLEEKYSWPILEFENGIKIEVEFAKTEEERALGLMFRKTLPKNRGMLFVFDTEDYQSFWMKNCFFPLDLIFIDQNFKIVDILENFQPCKEDPCPSYKSKEKAKFVLEIQGGFCKKHNLKIGMKCRIPI